MEGACCLHQPMALKLSAPRKKHNEAPGQTSILLGGKGHLGFQPRFTAEQVNQGIDGTALTAIVTGLLHLHGFTYFEITSELSSDSQHLLLQLNCFFCESFIGFKFRSINWNWNGDIRSSCNERCVCGVVDHDNLIKYHVQLIKSQVCKHLCER